MVAFSIGKMFIHFPPALFFFTRRLARAHLFNSLRKDQSTLAQRAQTTVAECSLTKCVWARFRIGSKTMPAQQHSQPTPSLDQHACVLRCNLPPSLLAEWPESFTYHCGNSGIDYRTLNKSQHTKLTLERKILPLLLPGFELATFRWRVQCCTNKPSRINHTY